jgi:RHS repeat-associated protein
MKTIAIGIVSLFGLLTPGAFAQVGSNSPGGFQNEITTGCSYDPYTLSARREITDISVSGSVGTYPLAFTRTATSRYNTGVSTDFGAAGSWQHSYQWSIDTDKRGQGSAPTSYAVNLPDGGRMAFSSNSDQGNIYGDPYFRSGIQNPYRLQVIWDTQTSGRLWLILPDGGKVYFTGQRTHPNNYYFFTYTLQSITDPYGQTTTVTGSSTNSPVTVTEPAGRWIKMYYRTITSSAEGALNDIVIDHVAASDGRSVQYNYTAYVTQSLTRYTSLTSVVYYGDPTVTATYAYQDSNLPGPASGRPLLSRCFDPMYPGPMVRIAYIYTYGSGPNADGTAVVAGQLQSENYFDGTTVGPAVSTISILPNGPYNRQETTGDGRTRKFLVGWAWTPKAGDFKGVDALQNIDMTYYWVNSRTDRNGNTTTWTNTVLTGRPVQITYPLTPNDTPPGTPRGTVTYTYGSATCPDPNNRDANNPYYPYSVTDEGGHTTVFLRDVNKRVIQINYPDGATESFTYNSFGQVLTHLLKTGGTETFSYDARGLPQTYRDAYHATGNPSFWYQYDSLDRASGTTDALGLAAGDVNHTTNFSYNSRGQLLTTTHPVDPNDGLRHSISNVYNQPLGTLASVTDELGHVTSYTYDDYRRPRSTTTPGHNTPLTSRFFYDVSGMGEDYTHTDANVTYAISPTGKKLITQYNPNKQKTSVTAVAANGISDMAVTSFVYDNNGNVTSVVSPNEQPGQLYAGKSTATVYDERNRTMSATDALNNITSFMYDAAGRKASVARANGQVTTFDSYDAMNRLLQQTVQQTPDPDAVTKYTYYTSGLLHTMQDPRLVATSSSYSYSYTYDLMGRKIGLQYPPDSTGVQTTEAWHYETRGLVDQFTNRDTKHHSFTFDNLKRLTDTHWDDNEITPDVHNGYDAASRLTSVTNFPNATISRMLFNDGLMNTETTTYADNVPRTVTYTYDDDSNRATIQWPNGAYSFTYQYTGRNQLFKLINNNGSSVVATFGYDPSGNLNSSAPDNFTSSAWIVDPLDRVTRITHTLTGTTRTLDYAYDSVSNRLWAKRDGNKGDVFGYDLNDQTIAVKLDVPNPDTTAIGSQTIVYDANGNRTTFSPYGSTDTYLIDNNSLNQYHMRNGVSASYDAKGSMTSGFDGSNYTYDAQNRILSAKTNTDVFAYDGANRQVKRAVAGVGTTYNVYDGWNLIAEYNSGSTSPSKAYLTGASGLVKELVANRYYYQDANGSTSHLASNTGNLLEWYRYDLQGKPSFYNASDTQIANTAYGIRHLFTGQQWYSEIGLYDLRNRFYSPDIGRFVQPDPAGFAGDASNIYRYVGNNPSKGSDPTGLLAPPKLPEQGVCCGGGDGSGSAGGGFGSVLDLSGVPDMDVWTAEFNYSSMTPYGSKALGAAYASAGVSFAGGGIGVSVTNGVPFAGFTPAGNIVYSDGTFVSGTSLSSFGTIKLQGNWSLTSAQVTINGHTYYNTLDALAALVVSKPESVTDLTVVGHGTSTSIQFGFPGVFKSSCQNGQPTFSLSVSSQTNIAGVLSNALSPTATVNFYGCYCATGFGNLVQSFSEAFPTMRVSGYTAAGYMVINLSTLRVIGYGGPTATYIGGVVVGFGLVQVGMPPTPPRGP